MVRSQFSKQDINFRVVTLKEPPKQVLIKYLDQEHQGHVSQGSIVRCARVEIVIESAAEGNKLWELLVDLTESKVLSQQHLEGKHSYIDSGYMQQVEKACMADERVQDMIHELNLPAEASVLVEPWAYATDGMNDMSKRITMVIVRPSGIGAVTDRRYSVGSISGYSSMRMRIITPTR